MKIYRIRKHKYSYLKNIYNANHKKEVKIVKEEWYQASRKGSIFGFWHCLGHNSDYDGMIWAHRADTIEEIEDYIQKWHQVNCGDTNYKIIKDL